MRGGFLTFDYFDSAESGIGISVPRTLNARVKVERESDDEVVLSIGSDKITIRASSDGSPCTYVWVNSGLVGKLRSG